MISDKGFQFPPPVLECSKIQVLQNKKSKCVCVPRLTQILSLAVIRTTKLRNKDKVGQLFSQK